LAFFSKNANFYNSVRGTVTLKALWKNRYSRLNGRMFLSFLQPRRSRFAFCLPALAVAMTSLAAAPPVFAQGTHLWTQSRLEELEKGTPQGVALASDGTLRQGPGLTERLTTPSTTVWSVAVDKSGTAYLGTASPATVLRVTPDGKSFTLFETKDLSVQVVRQGPDGALYAATMPSGRVYRLKMDATAKQDDSSATVVFDAADFDESGSQNKAEKKSHYIWEMTFDATGRLYIATGGPGAIYRLNPAKKGDKPELFFKSDEQHIRSLAWDAKGNLIAGTDGSGLVYRMSPEGKGYVLFEAPRREITSVAVAANGTIYAASVGDKSHNPLPPLPVQGAGSLSITIVQPGSMQAANASASVPEGSEIYALVEGQAPRKLWTGKDEIVYALAAQNDGLLVLTGNRGRVFKIANDGSYADIAHLAAQQGLSLVSVRGTALAVPFQSRSFAAGSEDASGVLIGTGNTGKLVLLGRAEKHEYASDVLDAGALARFGRVEVEPGSTGYELLTRTGNVEQPARGRNDGNRADWGWSDWQPLQAGAVASPAGRFLQWKAVLRANGSLGSVGINYLPVNAAPVVDDLVVVPGARLSAQSQAVQPTVNIVFPSSAQSAGATIDTTASTPLQANKDRTAVTVRWVAHDDNGDDLSYALYLRGDGESVWRLLKNDLTDKAYSFDAALIPDGGYQIKVVASDAPSHTPGDALTGEKISERFEVDTTPPVVSALKAAAAGCKPSACAKLRVSFSAEDAFSPIAHAEYSLDAGPWQYIEPVGGLSDSRREQYDVLIPVPAEARANEHLVAVRVYDRQENVGVARAVVAAPEK
jgi:sugar lactone lactonase YvrE